MKSKKQINLDEAAAGVTLAQEVLDLNGHCLMAADVVLTAANLASLKRRGIKNLVIWEEREISEEEMNARREACIASLEHRFRLLEDDAVMQQLKKILLTYRLQELD